MDINCNGSELVVELCGRISVDNVGDIEREVLTAVEATRPKCVTLNAEQLDYISSAGLRMVIKLGHCVDAIRVTNTSRPVYDVFEMTGITEIVSVRRRPRQIDLEGLRQIGAGAFGRVLRLDAERVVKVYDPHVNPLQQIEREREVARAAFTHGVPCAIPFETVRADDEFGIVYELVDALTLGEAIVAAPERLEDYARRMAKMLRQLHDTHFEQGLMPDGRRILYAWVDVACASGLYADKTIEALRRFVADIADADTFVHGDFHPGNIMVMPDGELLLIDMGDASVGDPVIDLSGLYHVVHVTGRRPGGAERFCGMPPEMLFALWDVFVRTYFETTDTAEIERIEQRLHTYALPRGMGSIARTKLVGESERIRTAHALEQEFRGLGPARP